MIYTSYFANWRKFPPGAKVIGVTRWPPHAFAGLNWNDLAPSQELLNSWKIKQLDEKQFKYQYLRELLGKDRQLVRGELRQLDKQAGNVVLCCYEKKGDFCHRHILAEWLDMGIEEL